MNKVLKKLTVKNENVECEQAFSVKDYVKLGKLHHMCPYYMMKTQLADCDVAIIPYNYVIDKDLRKQSEIELANSIIIFDEGHNIN